MNSLTSGMGWLVGRNPSSSNLCSESDNRKNDAKTMRATFDEDESHTSSKKFVLYAYLLWLGMLWANIANHFIGSFGFYIVAFLFTYAMVIIYPGNVDNKVLGHWDYQTRMQVRSILIVKCSIVSCCIGFPLWFLFVGDATFETCCIGLPVAPFRLAFLLYCAWFAVFDQKTPRSGQRFLPAFRERLFWRHMAAYFPVSLTRTAELDRDKNYLFGYHPHGIISVGCVVNFATNATGFDRLFPGIDVRVLTLASNFKVPFFREFLIWLGINDASRESIATNLSRGNGASVVVVVGGAAESLKAEPGCNDLVLKDRKGFVKCALRSGASLVPVYSFGECDIYQVKHLEGTARQLQMALQKKLGFALPLFFGRALSGGIAHKLFGTKCGLFPLRVPIHTVVGRPIECPRLDENEITQEKIDQYHEKYVQELQLVFDEWHEDFEKEKKKRFSELEENPLRKDIVDSKEFASVKKEGGELHVK